MRYVQSRTLSTGQVAFYWVPPKSAKGVFQTTALGSDMASVQKQATSLNQALDAWRAAPEGPQHAPGSIDALVCAFQQHRDYPAEPKTRDHYDYALRILRETVLPNGQRFGAFSVRDVKPRHADLFQQLLGTDTPRRTTSVLAAARRLWSWGYRIDLAPQENPWQKMGLESAARSGQPWPKASFDRFCAQAVAMGKPDIALAGLLARDLCQRPGDILALTWAQWDGERFTLTQHKTGTQVTPSASAAVKAALQARTPGEPTALIITTVSGVKYQPRRFAQEVELVRDQAGLPDSLIAKDWRHTGLTELGESGASLAELQAMSGHRTIDVLARYVRGGSSAADAAVARRDTKRQA